MAILKYQPPVNVITGTAGEAISQYNICYLNTSDGKYYKSINSGNEYQADACVIALEAMTANEIKKFALGKSKIYNNSWNFSKGSVAYLSSTLGGITTTKPVTAGYYIKPLGHFIDTNLLMFDPSLGYMVSQPTRVRPLDVVGGRLDLVSSTRIKWGFQGSNQIRLFDGQDWQTVECSTEPYIDNTSLDLNGTALVVDKIYDVFAEYSSSTAFSLVCSRWQTATAGTSSRTATWAGNTAYTIGDRVSTGSPLHYYVCITAHTSHTTTFSNDSANWVDNGVAPSNADFNGLYRHDGVLVSDSSTTGKKRRWLGIIYAYNNNGTVNFKDDVNYRYVSNWYNRKNNTVISSNSNSTWTLSTIDTYVEYNNGSGQLRGNFIVNSSSLHVISSITRVYNTNNGADTFVAIALNSDSSASVTSQVTASAYYYINVSISKNTQLPIGYNYITGLVRTNVANAVYTPIIHPYIILQG